MRANATCAAALAPPGYHLPPLPNPIRVSLQVLQRQLEHVRAKATLHGALLVTLQTGDGLTTELCERLEGTDINGW